MSFETDTQRKTELILQQAGPALEGLAAIAAEYHLTDCAGRLNRIQNELATEAFKLIVLGRFKNGKSTFLNALLGRLERSVAGLPHGGAPLPSHQDPCTAVLTSIHYATEPSVVAVHKDGRQTPWTLQEYLNSGSLGPDKSENTRLFRDIEEFRLGFPSELGRSGITLFDTPGYDENRDRDLRAHIAMQGCDAAIVLFQSGTLASLTEQQYLQLMLSDGLTNYFTVVNIWDNYTLDERARATIWNKLVQEMRGGPSYAQSDRNFDAHNIYLIQAKMAAEGKLAGDADRIERSGMAHFERQLSIYLERERRAVHVERHVNGARYEVTVIRQTINQLIPVASHDREQFEREYQRQLPHLEEIRRRKDLLPRIFERNRSLTQLALQTSYEELINRLCADLPAHMQTQRLPTFENTNFLEGLRDRARARFIQDRLIREATEIAEAFAQERRTEWERDTDSPSGAQQAIAPTIDQLLTDIEAEVTQIERGYAQVTFALATAGGNTDMSVQLETPHMGAKIIGVALSVLTLQPDYAFIGITQGTRGLWRDFGVKFGVAFGLALVHAPLVVIAPAAVVASLLINIIWGAAQLEREIKTKTARTMIDGDTTQQIEGPNGERIPFDGLRGEPRRVRALLAQSVDEMYRTMELAVTDAVDAAMRQEEGRIRAMLEVNSRGAEERRQIQTRMEAQLQEIQTHSRRLEAAVTIARQT